MIINIKSRKIGIKSKSVAGRFYSYKMRRTVQTESLLEMKYCFLFELCPMVIEYIEQPITIKINGKKYTPDFKLILKSVGLNSPPEIFTEIKPSVFHGKTLSKIQNFAEEIKEFYPNFLNHIFILTEKDMSESAIEILKNRYYRLLNSKFSSNILSECPFKSTNNKVECPLNSRFIIRCEK
ncbi:MAG: hypothetical protein QMD43_03125 [Thermodesulfovibrio sp.]|nr:hypothetical protein [Thermodesulfovibrio sp.]